MEDLDVYEVRAYRRGPTGTDGTIEAVFGGEQLPFHSSDGLWRALQDLSTSRRWHLTHTTNKEDPP